MKYVIDVPDSQIIGVIINNDCKIIRSGSKEEVIFEDNINGSGSVKLTHLEEPRYTADDAWELAGIIRNEYPRNLKKCFGTEFVSEIFSWGFSKAMEKYEAWKVDQETIKVGDEVAFYYIDSKKPVIIIVTRIDDNGFFDGMNWKGEPYVHKDLSRWTKTGRHFPQVKELLEKMKG